MEGLATLLVVIAAFVVNLPALREQWRADRAGSIKTIWMFGIYFLYIGLGIAQVAPPHRYHGRLGVLWRAHPHARGAALSRTPPVAQPFRYRRCAGARAHVQRTRRLSLGITLRFCRCSLNVLGKQCNFARVVFKAVELSLNGGFSDVCPGYHRRRCSSTSFPSSTRRCSMRCVSRLRLARR